MSDIQRDREERQHVIEVLQNMVDWMQAAHYIVAKPERIYALFYAIASIKTDLKYDLLYEETSGQADKPTTKNDLGVASGFDKNSKKLEKGTTKDNLGIDYLGVNAVSRQEAIDAIRQLYLDLASQKAVIDLLKILPSVTPQPKTGHWDDIPKYKDIAWQCSECGHFTTMKPNFCADCGCRMVEPQESEDKE